MYYQYFGLTEAPFSIAVNPRYLYMSPRHRDALAHLLYGVGAGGGFILLTGEVGTGKTTINRCLLEQLPDNADIAMVLNPALDVADLLATVCEELGIELAEKPPGLKLLTDSLHHFLLENHAAGRKTVLMIDEAQHLDFDVLEQIRLLTNLETNDEKLLHIILIGQPELAAKLALPELRQLNQRITARFNLEPLTIAETSAYIRHRLHVAGMPAGRELFAPGLVRAIHRESRGVPRLINLLCDRMLLGAYGRESDRLDRGLLTQAAREVIGSAPRQAEPPRWMLPVFVGAAIVLVLLALWLLVGPGSGLDEEPDSREAALEQRSSVTEAASESPRDNSAALKSQAPLADWASETGDLRDQAWRLSMQEGTELLARLYAVQAPTLANPCALELRETLGCERLSMQSWNQLVAEGRPVLLALLDARRFESTALLVGIDDDLGLLATPQGRESVPLAKLAMQWTGTVWQYWRKPDGVQRTLQRGDEGDDVERVAGLFARLDQQARPLSIRVFDERLERRVKLFQQQKGLRADGVLGENTLRALSLAVGDDLGFAEAQRWVEASLTGRPDS